MSGYRVVFITRCFWPHWDGESRAAGAIAAALVERGAAATVLTVHAHPQWPREFTWRGASVVRVPHDGQSRRGEIRYAKSLARWLRENRGRYDLVCASGLRHDACGAIEAVDPRVPVVLRAAAAGRRGDCLWQLDAWRGRRIKRRTMQAAALVGPGLLAQRELIAAGYPRERIRYVAHGVARQPGRDDVQQTAARESLAAEHAELALPDNAPLAVCLGRLERGRGLGRLVAAWERVAGSRPRARLWLVGAGSQRLNLHRAIDDRGLGGSVLLPGRFDEVDTLLAAADVFVLPGGDDLSVALLEAMASGLPVVAADTASNREAVDDQIQGLLVPPGDAHALAAALGRLIDRPDVAWRLGAEGRRRVAEHFPLAKMVREHISLFEDLLARKR